jgi:hypothetical protein
MEPSSHVQGNDEAHSLSSSTSVVQFVTESEVAEKIAALLCQGPSWCVIPFQLFETIVY